MFPTSKYPQIRYFLGDVRDRDRLMEAFRDIDIVVHVLLVASRMWMIVSPSPTALCGWCYFVSMALVYILDFGEYVQG